MITTGTEAARVLVGDCLASLRGMAAQSAHCCVTSPPYFGLRDYGHEGQIGLESTLADYVPLIEQRLKAAGCQQIGIATPNEVA